MDWEAWARQYEQIRGRQAFVDLFAPGATFQDPVTDPTADTGGVSDMTGSIFPDWRQRIDRIRGGEDWAFFEWTGTATYRGPGAEGTDGVPIEMHGATVVEVDGDGLVTLWRDYLDTGEPAKQIKAGLKALRADG